MIMFDNKTEIIQSYNTLLKEGMIELNPLNVKRCKLFLK